MVLTNEAIKEISLKVVFVVDSQKPLLEANLDSFQNLFDNLIPEKIPMVLQYNKRDINEIMPIEKLEKTFNPDSKFAYFEFSAIKGYGVIKALQRAVHLMIENLTLLKMLYNSNKNTILLLSSPLEDLKKQVSSYIGKIKEKIQ